MINGEELSFDERKLAAINTVDQVIKVATSGLNIQLDQVDPATLTKGGSFCGDPIELIKMFHELAIVVANDFKESIQQAQSDDDLPDKLIEELVRIGSISSVTPSIYNDGIYGTTTLQKSTFLNTEVVNILKRFFCSKEYANKWNATEEEVSELLIGSVTEHFDNTNNDVYELFKTRLQEINVELDQQLSKDLYHKIVTEYILPIMNFSYPILSRSVGDLYNNIMASISTVFINIMIGPEN